MWATYLALILELVWRYIPYMPIETIHSRSCRISVARWLYAVVAAYLDIYQQLILVSAI